MTNVHRDPSIPTVEPGAAAPLQDVLALLQRQGLPTEGVQDVFPVGYVVVRAEGELVGVAGLEVYAEDGLLRSVAVATPWRNRGLGRKLVEHRVSVARERRLSRVYLLTTTAADYFEKLGFKRVPRAQVSGAVARSAEFTTLCPDSAACLVLSIPQSTTA